MQETKIALIMVAMLSLWGCAGVTVNSGRLPGALAEAGVQAALINHPEVRPAVLAGCKVAWQAINAGNVAQAAGIMVETIKPLSKYSLPVLTVANALQVEPGAATPERVTEIKELIRRTGLMAGGTAEDFK